MTIEQDVLANYIESLINHIISNRESIEDEKILLKCSEIIQSLDELKENIEKVNLNMVSSQIKKIGKDWEKIYAKYC